MRRKTQKTGKGYVMEIRIRNIVSIITLAFCAVLIAFFTWSYNNKKEAKHAEYNNGICSQCGGHYDFIQAVGNRYPIFTKYIYKCDNCGNMIETYELYSD